MEVRVLSPALLVCLMLLAVGCSGDEKRSEPEPPVAGWAGPPRPDGVGRLEVEPFNNFLAGRADLAGSPLRAGIEFARLDRAQAATTSAVTSFGPEGAEPATVVLTADRLLDDSVRATRYTLRFVRDGAARWRLSSAVQVQRCWPGRGHDAFAAQPCV